MTGPRLQLADAAVALTASSDLAVQLVAARYVHAHLASGDIRDVKLVVVSMGMETKHYPGKTGCVLAFPYGADALGRLAGVTGISRARVSAAITRLLEAGVLTIQDGTDPYLVFVDRVLQPAGAAEYVEWSSVVDHIHGRGPALLVLCSLLDHIPVPWEWTSVTYQELAERSHYSLGMVRYGAELLVEAGVLERRARTGRGHQYRCSALALGRDTARGSTGPTLQDLPIVAPPPQVQAAIPESTVPHSPRAVSRDVVSALAETTVEIGDVILRVPPGTVIRVQVAPDGATLYEVGPHLRVTQRPAS